MKRVVFVCLGNICRSPTADAVFADMALRAGLDVESDSAGTSDWHIGNPPYGPMIEAAASRGYDLTYLRARQFGPADFTEFDLIIGMDQSNIDDMERLRPAGNSTPVELMLSYAPDTGVLEVPDPYFTRDFDEALDLIEKASAGLVKKLQG